ncbi:MAG: histidine phosphatase family protein [Deltaproteobacteria bacterium]|nr:histidine phosphatase family protein [Deltaproteobacteria bacterium]
MRELDVYLIRHEDAEDGDPDEHRALTAEGRRRMARTSKLLLEREKPIDLIRSSPLVRAVQTAEILATSLGVEDVEIDEWIANPPGLTKLLDRISHVPATVSRVAIVGHEPTLSGLVMLLFPHAQWTGMKRGAVLCARLGGPEPLFRFLVEPKGPTWREHL